MSLRGPQPAAAPRPPDEGHPEMAGKKLRDHVARIKREWALDGSFKPSEE